MRNRILITLFFGICSLLTACQAIPPKLLMPISTSTGVPAKATPQNTRTPSPTFTPKPTETPAFVDTFSIKDLPSDAGDFTILYVKDFHSINPENFVGIDGLEEISREQDGWQIKTKGRSYFVGNGTAQKDGNVYFYVNNNEISTTYGAIVLL